MKQLVKKTMGTRQSCPSTAQEKTILTPQLKKLGLTDADLKLQKLNLNSRQTRSHVKLIDQNCETNVKNLLTNKNFNDHFQNSAKQFKNDQSTSKRCCETIDSISACVTTRSHSMDKNNSNSGSSDRELHDITMKRADRQMNDMDSQSTSESDVEETDLFDTHCKTPGCDSLGHLSGAFDSHQTMDTCPMFHNQTSDNCAQRYQKRIGQINKQSKMSTISPKKSPNKKIKRVPENEPTWNEIMDIRKIEMKAITENQNEENRIDRIIPRATSSRQPQLTNFTSKFDFNLFVEAQARTAQLIHYNSITELKSDHEDNAVNNDQPESKTKTVQKVAMGRYLIDAWYSSPYSDDFQNCQVLYICEFCLKCLNSEIILERHINKCPLRQPPGDQIYHKENISFFEIDGQKEKEYCQNLCLLAKLFLNHKTLFFDVDPFLFYIMTIQDETGIHIVGYFSKEKRSTFNYNVSCILTLPSYQRLGYGRMLIEFSYLLTKSEGKFGSPERPLSDLGLISYRNYWKFVIMNYIGTYEGKEILLKGISNETGINPTDIVSTLQLMGLLKYWKGEHMIMVTPETKKMFAIESKRRKRLYVNRMIDPKCLSWTPKSWPIFK